MLNTQYINIDHVIVSKEDWEEIANFIDLCQENKRNLRVDTNGDLDINDPVVLEAMKDLAYLIMEAVT